MIPRMSDNISVVSRSPDLEPGVIEIVVTVPTFKRPEHLLATLASLNNQVTDRRFAVIVMENEAEERAGAKAAAPLYESGQTEGMLIIAHERGNCAAYNAGWLTALVHFPAFRYLMVIDDDELADPHWIERMATASEMLDADIVGGPQIPVFEHLEQAHWSAHPVFRPPYPETGPVEALYSSGNLLIRRSVLEKMGPPFLDLRFNFMGGGDSDFLSRSKAAGFALGWCSEAPVHETIPSRRLESDWIRARSIRNGVISALVEKRKRLDEPLGRVKVIAKSVLLLAASPFRGFRAAVRSRSLSIGLYPVFVGIGRVIAEFGYMNEQYRHADKN
ncbi:MAG: glycosyltransferase [Notoacmeibacter sp.]|nr:glycosyltransferase [Notoacmeibacter sp.]